MQDYERYQEIYSPNVRRSRTISRQGDTFKIYLQLFMKKVISVVLNTEYDVRYTRLSPTRVHVRSYSTRIAEVQDPGTADEKEKPLVRTADSSGASTTTVRWRNEPKAPTSSASRFRSAGPSPPVSAGSSGRS